MTLLCVGVDAVPERVDVVSALDGPLDRVARVLVRPVTNDATPMGNGDDVVGFVIGDVEGKSHGCHSVSSSDHRRPCTTVQAMTESGTCPAHRRVPDWRVHSQVSAWHAPRSGMWLAQAVSQDYDGLGLDNNEARLRPDADQHASL